MKIQISSSNNCQRSKQPFITFVFGSQNMKSYLITSRVLFNSSVPKREMGVRTPTFLNMILEIFPKMLEFRISPHLQEFEGCGPTFLSELRPQTPPSTNRVLDTPLLSNSICRKFKCNVQNVSIFEGLKIRGRILHLVTKK